MDPFQDPAFELSVLDEHELGHLEYILNSPSYTRVFKPFLESLQKAYVERMLNPDPATRQKYGGDEYLRCGANNIQRQLEFYEKVIAETQHQRAMSAREALGEVDLYRQAVAEGKVGPSGQIRTPDYADVEEF